MILPPGVIDILRRALEEDLGAGDITTSLLIPEENKSSAQYIAKAEFVLAGLPFIQELFRQLDPSVHIKTTLNDGFRASTGDSLGEISGKTRSILAGERTSLNLLQRLSGIATMSSIYVEKIKGTRAKIVDTRKTTPCLRFMEKYAVRVGGGQNHRFGLFDGILIKDNHIQALGNIRDAVAKAKSAHHLTKIEVEVSNTHDLSIAIESGADIVMLDNMSIEEMKESVRVSKGRVLLEASGGINLENVRAVAETGVDFISVGSLTHSSPSVDISLEIVK
jgi:nicotinate-nucleotide pyrophosphorylase (carboxylating)